MSAEKQLGRADHWGAPPQMACNGPLSQDRSAPEQGSRVSSMSYYETYHRAQHSARQRH